MLILGTAPGRRLDKIVEFAARAFDVPISLVSLVDGRRQWLKARRTCASMRVRRCYAGTDW